MIHRPGVGLSLILFLILVGCGITPWLLPLTLSLIWGGVKGWAMKCPSRFGVVSLRNICWAVNKHGPLWNKPPLNMA